MFTKNAVNFMRAAMVRNPSVGLISQSYKNVSGSTITEPSTYIRGNGLAGWMHAGRCRSLNAGSASSVNAVYAGVYFGTDPTPATEDDYTLGAVITSGLSISNQGYPTIVQESDDVYSVFAVYTIENTTSSSINIYEIGLFTPINTAVSDTMYPVLMEHTVLDVPISIAAGESKSVTYKLTFNQTLNVE